MKEKLNKLERKFVRKEVMRSKTRKLFLSLARNILKGEEESGNKNQEISKDKYKLKMRIRELK